MTYDEALRVLEPLDAHLRENKTSPGGWDEIEDYLVSDSVDSEHALLNARALATAWRHDVGKPGYRQPSRSLVSMVEDMIGEPVWDTAEDEAWAS